MGAGGVVFRSCCCTGIGLSRAGSLLWKWSRLNKNRKFVASRSSVGASSWSNEIPEGSISLFRITDIPVAHYSTKIHQRYMYTLVEFDSHRQFDHCRYWSCDRLGTTSVERDGRLRMADQCVEVLPVPTCGFTRPYCRQHCICKSDSQMFRILYSKQVLQKCIHLLLRCFASIVWADHSSFWSESE